MSIKYSTKAYAALGSINKDKKDCEKILFWLKKSVEMGNFDGKMDFGEMLMLGQGVDQDVDKGIEYYEQPIEESLNTNWNRFTETEARLETILMV